MNLESPPRLQIRIRYGQIGMRCRPGDGAPRKSGSVSPLPQALHRPAKDHTTDAKVQGQQEAIMAVMAPDGNNSKKSDGAIRERAIALVVIAPPLGKCAKGVATGTRDAPRP